jgi:hypothetical protein
VNALREYVEQLVVAHLLAVSRVGVSSISLRPRRISERSGAHGR